jgi:fructose-1-phosphate kinase PfkB-like protein
MVLGIISKQNLKKSFVGGIACGSAATMNEGHMAKQRILDVYMPIYKSVKFVDNFFNIYENS